MQRLGVRADSEWSEGTHRNQHPSWRGQIRDEFFGTLGRSSWTCNGTKMGAAPTARQCNIVGGTTIGGRSAQLPFSGGSIEYKDDLSASVG